jgi:hypothetical protein
MARDTVRAGTLVTGHRFLVQSEQRVIAHCRAMLRRDDLEAGERQKLMKVLREADLRLRWVLMAAA